LKIIKRNIQCLIIIILFFACNQHNEEKIHTVLDLEKITERDILNLNALAIDDVESSLKIAKLNLSKIEEKKLDSIEVELIYFEYHSYLTCINKLYDYSQNINILKNKLATNQVQLKNIKSDYKNSRERRRDLDNHLLNEKQIVEETANKVFNTIKIINEEQSKFYSLNEKIEEIIK
tara:strand:- start:66 stop:596 length:531 start_codon:yes stop_codon:yes gene_type:complete